MVYDLARELPGVEAVPELSDQLGRVGRGLVGVQLGERIELIFATDCSELLGYQWFLAEPQPFAPVGTLHSWSAFVQRTVGDHLPADVPPIPRLPCGPPGARQVFPIRPGFNVFTGALDDTETQREAPVSFSNPDGRLSGHPSAFSRYCRNVAKAGASFLAWRSAGSELSRLAPARARDGGC